jgi:uncharacterized membrane protein YcaP (DUF421 family)
VASAATLLVLNRLLTFVFLHSDRFRHLVGGGPVLLVHDGRPIEEHLHKVGMTRSDLDEALRARGYADTAAVREAVLETDGTVSVIAPPDDDGPATSSR